MNFFQRLSTKEDILKNVGNQAVIKDYRSQWPMLIVLAVFHNQKVGLISGPNLLLNYKCAVLESN